MLKKSIKKLLLFALLLSCNMAVWADENIIEHNGDHYIINVDALHPDSEMTLMDVLHACPELTAANSGTITGKYVIYIDYITHYLDPETFLLYTKASEVSQIAIYNFGCVTQGSNGEAGIINITYKEPAARSTYGKVAFEGSTYGNGKLYADITTQQKNITVRGYALTNLQYAKSTAGGLATARNATENAHLDLDWNIITQEYKQYISDGSK